MLCRPCGSFQVPASGACARCPGTAPHADHAALPIISHAQVASSRPLTAEDIIADPPRPAWRNTSATNQEQPLPFSSQSLSAALRSDPGGQKVHWRTLAGNKRMEDDFRKQNGIVVSTQMTFEGDDEGLQSHCDAWCTEAVVLA